MLLKNNNKSINLTLSKPQEMLIQLPKVFNILIKLQILKMRKNLYLQIRFLASKSHNQVLTQRLLFRKIIKGIDKKKYELKKANIKIKKLKKKLKHLRPKKKRKVQINPNSKFAIIRAIKKTQIATKKRQIKSVKSKSKKESKSTISCIEVDAE